MIKNCETIREKINLYLDNELFGEEQEFIRKHLEDCSDCLNLFLQEKRLEQKVAEIINQSESDDEIIWNKAINTFRTKSQAVSNSFWTSKLRYLVPLSAAAMVIIGIIIVFLPGQPSDLLADVYEQHYSSLKPDFQLALKTDSLETLTTRFHKQYNFCICGYSCNCMTEKNDYNLKGGKICSMGQRPAAHILIDYQNTPVSLLVLSEKDLRFFPEAQSYLNRSDRIYQTKYKNFNCAMVKRGDNIICAIGLLQPETLKQLLIGTGAKHCNQCPDEKGGD